MSKKKKKRILIIILFVLLLFAAAYTVFLAPMLKQEVVEYEEAVVEKGSLIIGVTESGYLEYEVNYITYDLDLSVILSDEEEEEDSQEVVQKYLTIEEVYAAPGQMVEAGDALLKFSQESIAQVRKLLENALVDARVDYNEAESEYRLALLEAENSLKMQSVAAEYAEEIYTASIASASNDITATRAKLEKYEAQTADLQEAVTQATQDYAEAKATYEEIKAVYDVTGVDHLENYLVIQKNYASAKSAYERAESVLEQAQAALESNTEQLKTLKSQLSTLEAKKEIQILEAQQEYEETLLSGNNAQYSFDSTVESLEADLEEAKEEKTALEEKLAAFEELVGEDGILYAPDTGKITEVAYSAGDTLERTGTLFAYIMEDGMSVSVDVTQEDIVSLSVGDEVEIEFIAYEGESYKGSIYSIDTTATSVDTPTISYTVQIQVEGTLDKIFGGMSTNITFVTDYREETLYVPRKAIVEENGKTYVYVKPLLGDMQLKEVETGVRNESSVEILSGLEEGDKIYMVSYGETN